jgi:hypothetical protein
VVPADECYPVGVSDFEAKKKQKGFEGVEAAVNKIACFWLARPSIRVAWQGHTHEKVVGIRYVAAHTEKFHEIMELAMDVATNGYWGVDVGHVPARMSASFLSQYISRESIPFLQQDLPSLVADLFYLIIVSAGVRAFDSHRKCACALRNVDTYIRLGYRPTCSELFYVFVQVAHLLLRAPRRCNLSRRRISLRRMVLSRSRRGSAATQCRGFSLDRDCRSSFVYARRFRSEILKRAEMGVSRLSQGESTGIPRFA